jgi:predicted transcriptional regulator
MPEISILLKEKKNEFGWANRKISLETGINETTISKHLTGDRKVSPTDLKQYCKCFGLDFDSIKLQYPLEAIDVCKKGTIKTILASIAGIGVGTATYMGVKSLIDDKCKTIK